MPSCRFFKTLPDGCYGRCLHPEVQGQPDDGCVFNQSDVDFCYLREPIMTSMQLSKDTLDELREYGYPAEKALIKLLEIAKSKS